MNSSPALFQGNDPINSSCYERIYLDLEMFSRLNDDLFLNNQRFCRFSGVV